jgi:hypothetical protein
MARLFYHSPLYAVLDECTSAVSDEIEGTCYTTCKLLGITLFTVSHRPQLAKYHDVILSFLGNGAWATRNVVPSDNSAITLTSPIVAAPINPDVNSITPLSPILTAASSSNEINTSSNQPESSISVNTNTKHNKHNKKKNNKQ